MKEAQKVRQCENMGITTTENMGITTTEDALSFMDGVGRGSGELRPAAEESARNHEESARNHDIRMNEVARASIEEAQQIDEITTTEDALCFMDGVGRGSGKASAEESGRNDVTTLNVNSAGTDAFKVTDEGNAEELTCRHGIRIGTWTKCAKCIKNEKQRESRIKQSLLLAKQSPPDVELPAQPMSSHQHARAKMLQQQPVISGISHFPPGTLLGLSAHANAGALCTPEDQKREAEARAADYTQRIQALKATGLQGGSEVDAEYIRMSTLKWGRFGEEELKRGIMPNKQQDPRKPAGLKTAYVHFVNEQRHNPNPNPNPTSIS